MGILKSFRFTNADNQHLKDLSEYYSTTNTDIIASLLEIAWNSTCNKECMKTDFDKILNGAIYQQTWNRK